MSLARWMKARFYPSLPSLGPKWHGKRRKGLGYRYFPEGGLECQQEQDRAFWSAFLRPERGGWFLEIGGDGVTGSHTLGLEQLHRWRGAVYAQAGKPLEGAKEQRKCRVLVVGESLPTDRPVNLLAIHWAAESTKLLESLLAVRFCPRWIIIENREPEVHWCRLLESRGYQLKFFCHDDEYYELKA